MRQPLIAAGLLAATLATSSLAYAQQPPPPPQPGGAPTNNAAPPPTSGPGGGPPGVIILEGPPQGGSANAGSQSPVGANPLIMGGPAAARAMQEQMMHAQQGGPPPMGMGGPRGPYPMMMGGGPERREMGERMMEHMHPPRGAMFVFRRGDARIIIKCADDEPTKACVDGATALLDKLPNAPAAPGGGSH